MKVYFSIGFSKSQAWSFRKTKISFIRKDGRDFCGIALAYFVICTILPVTKFLRKE